MTGASIRFQGDKKIIKVLDRLASQEERRNLLDSVASYGVSSTQQRFLDEQGPDGKKWKKSRRAEKKGGVTLQKSRRLFKSLIGKATATMAAWGTNVVYAGIHHFGGTIRPKNAKALAFKGMNGRMVITSKVEMPARPYLGINELDSERIGQLASKWVLGMAK